VENPLARLRFARDHRWSRRHLSEFVDGEMTAGQRLRVERHTRNCRECRALLDSVEMMVSMLAGLSARPKESVASGVLARVHERLVAEDDQLA
jgi:anti-sigma factor RsiW